MRKMERADVVPVGRMMARAFEHDPLQRWIWPNDATRLASLERIFTMEIASEDPPHWYTDDECASAAFWMEPAEVFTAPNESAIDQEFGAALGDSQARWLSAMTAMANSHPNHVAHWYLEGIGVDPASQGEGRATALLVPMLARADRDDTPAYLEATNERNVPIYEHFGFRVIGTIDVAENGPRLWEMWRDPVNPVPRE